MKGSEFAQSPASAPKIWITTNQANNYCKQGRSAVEQNFLQVRDEEKALYTNHSLEVLDIFQTSLSILPHGSHELLQFAATTIKAKPPRLPLAFSPSHQRRLYQGSAKQQRLVSKDSVRPQPYP